MIPITLGTTSRIPPATPDLAGRPTCSGENKQTSYVTGGSALRVSAETTRCSETRIEIESEKKKTTTII